MDGWTETETAYLLHAIDPLQLTAWVKTNGGKLEADFPLQFDALKELVARAFKMGALATQAAPNAVIAWAMEKGLKLPALLIPADLVVKDELSAIINYTVKPKIASDSVPTDTAFEVESSNTNGHPWLIVNSNDPAPKYSWYTPARYFARQLVSDDSTLLTKKSLLASKVVQSLTSAGFKKRGKLAAFGPATVKKAFSGVVLS